MMACGDCIVAAARTSLLLSLRTTMDKWLRVLFSPELKSIVPKVLILSMFSREAEVWHNIPEFDILAQRILIPGASPLSPYLHCTHDASVCQLTIGEGLVNAAASVTALAFSPLVDLRKTYVLVAGIAGVNPKIATIGSVTFARYAVQVGLQYEIDAREIPPGWDTGYFAQGTKEPGRFPEILYGTEVFEVNDALRRRAFAAAEKAQLKDTDECKELRTGYKASTTLAAAISPPSIVLCDTLTSDTFWGGSLLGTAFENTMTTFTNGSGVYCTAQQEDNAILAVFHRASLVRRADFARIVIMRSASNFDRPPDGRAALESLRGPSPGFAPALRNLYVAGVKVVELILGEWDDTFERGVRPTNRVGDVFRALKVDVDDSTRTGAGVPTPERAEL
ncbi:purine nucleoside permease-like protein [Mycena amicta]|nr:purine nucleoside permease-like protein [Mycena amicta]